MRFVPVVFAKQRVGPLLLPYLVIACLKYK